MILDKFDVVSCKWDGFDHGKKRNTLAILRDMRQACTEEWLMMEGGYQIMQKKPCCEDYSIL
jgi:hypothetical protein